MPETRASGGAKEESRFFEAAEPLLERYGYRKTTVREICDRAGASKRTFYELFEDKKDLVVRLIVDVWNRETDRWEEGLEVGADPESQLASALALYRDVLGRHPVLQVVSEDLEIMRSLGSAIEEFRVTRVGGAMERILRTGMESGRFRSSDPQLMLWVIFGILDCFYVVVPRITGEPGPTETPQLADEIEQFLLYGVRTGSDEQ